MIRWQKIKSRKKEKEKWRACRQSKNTDRTIEHVSEPKLNLAFFCSIDSHVLVNHLAHVEFTAKQDWENQNKTIPWIFHQMIVKMCVLQRWWWWFFNYVLLFSVELSQKMLMQSIRCTYTTYICKQQKNVTKKHHLNFISRAVVFGWKPLQWVMIQKCRFQVVYSSLESRQRHQIKWNHSNLFILYF